jgi:hypothetical protein
MNKPIIHVLSYAQISTSEYATVMPIYHLDQDEGALSVPRRMAVYSPQTLPQNYRVWLASLVEANDPTVQIALENIYEQATHGGVVIATLAQCVPFYTHAHVVKEMILELAAQPDEEPESQED